MQEKLFNNKSIFIFLTALTFLGFLVRTVGLSDYPNGFTRDEAYLGYNAYSILKTGHDINGNFLPLFIESFLYTPAGYSYFSIPFISIFGLNIFSVRILSALFGSFTIPLIYLFVKKLFQISSKEYKSVSINFIAFLTSFLLAITPWHINLSRTASVSTVVTFFIILGCVYLFQWIQVKKKIFYIFSIVSLLLSLFFYIAPYTFLPFILLIVLTLFYSKIRKQVKFFMLLFALIIIPVIFVFTNETLSLRAKSLSLTRNPIVPITLTTNSNQDGITGIGPTISRVFHNKLTVLGDLYFKNYFDHLSYNFFFTDKSFPDRFRIPESGLIYPILLPFFLIGIYSLASNNKKLTLFLISWIFVSPIGSSFANDDVPNMQRTLFMLPAILIIIAIGIQYSYIFTRKKLLLRVFLYLISIIFLYQISFFAHQFVVHANAYRPWYRQEGYIELVEKINKYEKNYNSIVITNRESAPTIFVGFFKNYDPEKLQNYIKKSSLKDTDRISFDKYEISEDECPARLDLDKKTGKEIIVGKKNKIYVISGLCEIKKYSTNFNVLETIKRTDNSTAFYIVNLK